MSAAPSGIVQLPARRRAVSRPRSLKALEGAGRIKLTWRSPKRGKVDRYEVRHYLRTESRWSRSKWTRSTSRTYKGLQRRGIHGFKVRATNRRGAGRWVKVRARLYIPDLPLISITTRGRQRIVSKDKYLTARIRVDPNGSDVPGYRGTLKIRGRGNSTWAPPKKPYKLKLDSKAPLLGLPAGKKWALLANWFDASQLRTSAAFYLGRQTRLAWTPASRHVEVQLNGEYLGLYQLAETVRIGSNRVDIDELGPEDTGAESITGGYLLEHDTRRPADGDFGFRSSLGQEITIKDPEPDADDGISESDLARQKSYIKKYVNRFEASLSRGDFKKYINTRSFIDWFLVQELTGNSDSIFSSAYMYKPRSKKLFAGPLWDFDMSIGLRRETMDPGRWWLRDRSPWFSELFASPGFRAEARRVWSATVSDFSGVNRYLRALDHRISRARKSNTKRWPAMALHWVNEADYVTWWLRSRMDWMGRNL